VIAPVASESLPLTEQLVALLALVGAGQVVRVETRSLNLGVRSELRIATDGLRALPDPLLVELEGRRSALALSVATFEGIQEPVSSRITCAFALWRPRTVFGPEASGWRHAVHAGDAGAIREALAGFLEPTAVVDAGPTIAALWALAEPIAWADRDAAITRQRQLAARLGSYAALGEDLAAASIPLPGSRIREWNTPAPAATFAQFTPTRRYRAAQLDAALAGRTKGKR
jgi:hypothetical protein